MIEDNPNYDETIPLHDWSTEILRLIKDFCEKADYQNKDFVDKPIYDPEEVFKNKWERDFFESLSNE